MTPSLLPDTAHPSAPVSAGADRLHLAGAYTAFALIAAVSFGTLFASLF